jgi:Zn-dependent protease with chaperone function
MKTKNKKAPQIIFPVLLMAAFACVSLVNLCSWLLSWCLRANFVKEAVFIGGILTICVFAFVWQAVRTSWHIKNLFAYAQIKTSPEIESLISQFGLQPSQIILVQSPQPMAFCFGFLRPRICLSTGLLGLLSSSQLRAALLHEDYHCQHFDPLRILLLEALGTALFFLPIVQEWRSLYKIKLELAADAYAVQRGNQLLQAHYIVF